MINVNIKLNPTLIKRSQKRKDLSFDQIKILRWLQLIGTKITKVKLSLQKLVMQIMGFNHNVMKYFLY